MKSYCRTKKTSEAQRKVHLEKRSAKFKLQLSEEIEGERRLRLEKTKCITIRRNPKIVNNDT